MAVLRTGVLVLLALAAWPLVAQGAEMTLEDAIDCKDFKRNADGSWYVDDVTMAYGPGLKYHMILHHSTIRPTKGPFDSHTPIFDLLNEKCAAGK